MIVQALHQIQEEKGYLPREDLVKAAERLGVPLYRLNEVASFFPHFRLTPPATVEVHVCRDMACHLAGATALTDALKTFAGTFKPGTVHVGGTSCLGRCDRPTAVVINERLYTRRTAADLEAIISGTVAGNPPVPDRDADGWTHTNAPWQADPYEGTPTYAAVRRYLAEPDSDRTLAALKASDLRGMGGAGVPAARKWADVRDASGDVKYIVCNGDESEPATFKDRELLLRTPHLVVEGVIMAGLVTGATRGYIYIRHEYHEQIKAVYKAIADAETQGVCGDNLLGTGRSFPVEVFISPGGYICGEQSALIEAMEDRRAEPRNKPPELATNGLRDRPTVVNNVETLAWVPSILLNGGEWYRDRGVNGYKGLRFFSVCGDVARPGVYEVPCGITVGEFLREHAQGMRGGRAMKAFAPSGPSGGFLPPRLPRASLPGRIDAASPAGQLLAKLPPGEPLDLLDVPMDIQSFRDLGLMLGAGVAFYAAGADMIQQAVNGLEFYRNESCGKCVPCRIGSQKLVEIGTDLKDRRLTTDEFVGTKGRAGLGNLVVDLARTMEMTAICGLGAVAAAPLTSVMKYFPDEVERYLDGSGALPVAAAAAAAPPAKAGPDVTARGGHR